MRLPVLAFSTATALALGVLGAAPPAGADPPDGIVVKDGVTQPVFPYSEAITESVFVETRVDSDADGKRDRVHLRITRPGTAVKVAALVEESPYWAGILDVPNHGVDVDTLPLAAGSRGLYLRELATTQEYFVTRGYAYIKAESIGSGLSDGCPTTGDQNETLGGKAIVEWLTGKAKGYTDAGAPAAATWSAGSVGMLGVSYNGTLPNMVATTGVAGLKTILPVSAISSWYDYYRANGLVVAPGGYQGEDADVLARAVLTRRNPEACAALMDSIEQQQDRVTGDNTQFWRDRDYVGKASRVTASVFITHGLEDWNVKTKHFATWWDALAKAGVQRKLWLHPGGHGSSRHEAWAAARHRWIDHYLYDVDNGIDREQIATIERSDATVTSYADWPDPAAAPVALPFGAGKLGAASPKATESFVDNGSEVTAEQLAADPDTTSPNRLAYTTTPLTSDVRLSGTPTLELRASIDNASAANVTALLVDYGPTGATIVTRGWTDPRNRGSANVTQPVQPGQLYWLRFDQQPKDHVFAAGHRIGLVLLSTDYDYTLRPSPGTRISVRVDKSTLTLPLVGALG
jgi:X-Pro dipeptidyl-peptidase